MTKTEVTFNAMIEHSGWHSETLRSPSPSAATIPSWLLAEGEGWESASYDREPQEGFEYAVEPGCTRDGFAGRAELQYYRRVKRALR